jgi:hypothetical protein
MDEYRVGPVDLRHDLKDLAGSRSSVTLQRISWHIDDISVFAADTLAHTGLDVAPMGREALAKLKQLALIEARARPGDPLARSITGLSSREIDGDRLHVRRHTPNDFRPAAESYANRASRKGARSKLTGCRLTREATKRPVVGAQLSPMCP